MEELDNNVDRSLDSSGRFRFDGEDTSATTKRELKGWYTYGLAAEIFAVCGVGSFLPVTLEQLARENGVLWSDRTAPCLAADVPALNNSTLSARAQDPGQCVLHLLGSDITTSSFAMYTFSAAVFIQALTLASFSAVADYGSYRKKMLLAFDYIGGSVAIAFLLVSPALFWIAAVMSIITITCLGSSFVLLNSFIPLLAVNHPDSHTIGGQKLRPGNDIADEKKGISPELQMSNRISSKGVAIGYTAAVSIQILSIGILFLMKKLTSSPSLPLRIVVFMSGACWVTGTILTQLWLKDRPGPPLLKTDKKNKLLMVLGYIGFAWASLWRTIKQAARLRQAFLFLIAWFLLSDATATISGTAILFARTELKMSTVAVAFLSITATLSGIVGAYLWPKVSAYFQLSTNHTIIACIVLAEIIPLYGLLGYLPFIQALGIGGLQKPWEIYPLGVLHGIVMGGLSSYCRSFFGRLIPPGREAAFYALMAITDKGSSAVGPVIVGKIVDTTGHIRPAFVFLGILILLPGPIMWVVDVDRGRQDALEMARKLQGERIELMSRNIVDNAGEDESLLAEDVNIID